MLLRQNTAPLLCLTLCLGLAACAKSPSNATAPTPNNKVNESSNNSVANALYQQLDAWQGVPYKLGGTSKKGIDCSAFVQTTYIDRFGFLLPRTTLKQAEFGNNVSKTELQAGDLVFFKTGFRTYHVGIYIEDNQFLHASTSQGVIVSSLKNSYWRSAFWQAKRINF